MSARRRVLAVLAPLALVAPAGPAGAVARTPTVQAHRGGSVLDGRPAFPENTLPAFRNAARVEGAALEMDVKLTRDHVPVVIHDAALDRTTTCAGLVAARTLRELRRCRANVLGSPGSGLPTKRVRRPSVVIPSLASVLHLAKTTGATVNVEIKNLPTDGDFDPTPAYANRVMDTIIAAGLPRRQLIVQSFLPANLDVAARRLPGVALSFLTVAGGEEGGLTLAQARGYRWVSPSWPVSGSFVARVHAAGKRLVPYTLDRPAEVRSAKRARVDALITDDPAMARDTLR